MPFAAKAETLARAERASSMEARSFLVDEVRRDDFQAHLFVLEREGGDDLLALVLQPP